MVLTFILPPEAGEKVSLSEFCILTKNDLLITFFIDITILLTMVVFMDQLSQQTPPMSSKLPIIGRGRQMVGLKFCQFAIARIKKNAILKIKI